MPDQVGSAALAAIWGRRRPGGLYRRTSGHSGEVIVENMNSRNTIEIRLATAADLLVLRSLYAETVDELGPAAYTPAQIAAWKSFASQSGFDDFILGVSTYLAVIDAEIVGFCGIANDGHVASVYVGSDWCGRGVGTALLSQVLARHPTPTSGCHHAEASTFSLPLFERCGFRQVGTERVIRDGVAFERFLVVREAVREERLDDG